MRRTICAIIILSAACDVTKAQSAPAPPPPPPEVQTPPPATPAEAMQRAGGSLLRATVSITPDPNQAKLTNVSYFAVPQPEPRTIKKHDLVTIIVREESQFKSEGTTDLKKQADLDAKIEQFVTLNLANKALQNAIGADQPEFKLSGQRNLKGEATVDRSDSLTLRVTAEVVDVKPNGTLVLQARARIKTDEEEQQFVLSGVCRAEDVTPDNTILSTQLFDEDVSKTHKGAVRDTTKRGWIPKLLDTLNPF